MNMHINKTVTTVFALIGIFLCGAVAGGVLAVRFWPPLASAAVRTMAVDQQLGKLLPPANAASGTVTKKTVDQQLGNQQWVRITNRLDPTPEQQERIRALVAAFTEAQQKSRALERDAIAKLDEDICAVLTPEQAVEYKKNRARNRENERLWQRWYREQRAKHGESPLVAPKPVGNKDSKSGKSGKAPRENKK